MLKYGDNLSYLLSIILSIIIKLNVVGKEKLLNGKFYFIVKSVSARITPPLTYL